MADGEISYKPLSGMVLPRFAGIATFMRLPHVAPEDAGGVDTGLTGVPWDGGQRIAPGPDMDPDRCAMRPP